MKSASIARYKSGERIIIIKFPFNRNTLDFVRTLPGRKWNVEKKIWHCPLSIEAIEKLYDYKFSFDVKLQIIYERIQKGKLTKQKLIELSEVDIPGMKNQLFSYQKKGVHFIDIKNGRCLIGDEMGLGKTVQSLGWFQLHKEIRPVIIVCPASLKYNWRNEIIKWIDYRNINVLEGGNPYRLGSQSDFIIINYDILNNWKDELLRINPKALIIDECQYIKNNSAKRTKTVKRISKTIPHIIALSGTPILNCPVEFYNIISILDKKLFPNYMQYAHRFCNAYHNGFGWDMSGASNTQELYKILSENIMLRRLKKDVLQELPEKIYSFVPILLDNRKEYEQAENNFLEYLEQYKGNDTAQRAANAEILTEIEGLKQVAIKGKLKMIINWIENILEDNKLVVFANHKFVIDNLCKHFYGRVAKVDGTIIGIQRQAMVDRFQRNPNVKLFVGNIRAAGVGITLTAANKVAFIELPWTPGELIQAEDRCHRIGQKDNVTVYQLLAMGTIEEKIASLLDSKRKILDLVLDGVQTNSSSLIMELINQYKN
jgi:SWI/SNF-related matrix-associated actin-dependent regulator 1 of chromatin subfamily A